MSTAFNIGAAVGGLASGLLGSFNSSDDYSLTTEQQVNMMTRQAWYNYQLGQRQFENQRKLMSDQYLYNSALADKSFEQNKWFTQHQYQNAIDDLRAAGLNPLLGLPNGNSGSVGMASVSGGNASMNGVGLLDPASAVSADTNKKKLVVDTALGVANTFADVRLKNSASAKAGEEAKTEATKRENLTADTDLKRLTSFGKSIETNIFRKNQSIGIISGVVDITKL